MDALVRHWSLVALEEARRSERVRTDASLPQPSQPTQPTQPTQPSLAARLGKATGDAWRRLVAEREPTPSAVDAPTPLAGPVAP
jgi:hypothetical protein